MNNLLKIYNDFNETTVDKFIRESYKYRVFRLIISYLIIKIEALESFEFKTCFIKNIINKMIKKAEYDRDFYIKAFFNYIDLFKKE